MCACIYKHTNIHAHMLHAEEGNASITDFDIDDAWDTFSMGMDGGCDVLVDTLESSNDPSAYAECPEPSPLKVSTKTKIAYIEPHLDVYDLFWKIPIVPYHTPTQGTVKKEMKCNSNTKEEFADMFRRCESEEYVRFHIVKHIDKTTGNIHFKDVRKIISGISKHDVIHKRGKQKSAFFNCIVVNIRLRIGDTFKEYHIKLFNSGKLEMPGTHEPGVYEAVVSYISKMITETTGIHTTVLNHNHTALVNSNFTTNFHIDRDKLMNRLKTYDIISSFDPCSYPGVRNIIRFKNIFAAFPELNDMGLDVNLEDTISCMIFRTGSVLLIGKCCDVMLDHLYKFICCILKAEYKNIAV